MTARQQSLLRRHQTPLDNSPPWVSASASLFTVDNTPPVHLRKIDALNRQLARARQQFPTTDAMLLFQRAHKLLTQDGVGASDLFAALTGRGT
jgi:hypothetical protein